MIYIDLSYFMRHQRITGVPRVILEFVRRFLESDLPVCYLYDESLQQEYTVLSHKVVAQKCNNYTHMRRLSGYPKFSLSACTADDILLDLDWQDRRHFVLPQLKVQNTKIAAFVHDLIPFYYPEDTEAELGGNNIITFIGAHVQYADLLLTGSNTTAEDLSSLQKTLALPPVPIKVIGLGCNYTILDDRMNGKNKYGRYLLAVGTIEPRKNIDLLVAAFENELVQNTDLNLVLVGKIGWISNEFRDKLLNHAQLNKRIFVLTGVSDEQLATLYEQAYLYVFLSKTEGYGLPLVEALAHGTVALVSDISIFRELGGTYCEYFSLHHSASDLAVKIRNLYDEPKHYQALKQSLSTYRPLSWDEAFANLCRALKQMRETDNEGSN